MEMNLTFTGKRRRIVRFLLMSLLSCMLILPAQAQDRVTVSGRLTDTGQNPLIGASVIERGTTNGVTTDVDGRYQISVAKNATLDFSFVGYKTQSVAVANRTQIDVTLEEDAMMIGEVVAIGYGSQRKEDLSMAVTTVKVDEGARSRAADLGTLLQGRMPGVTILQSGGDPMRKASFSIRGRGSKGNDDDPTSGDGVLVVVDGVPNAPYSVEDVETVTVLKDAASAAIYGASVGSSGVILITTRKAEAGKMRVNVNAAIGVQKAMNLPNMLNARQYCDVWAKAVGNSVNGSLPNLANPEVYAGADVTRTDWLDEIFRTGMTQHYGISLSGGTEKISSILSVTYDKKEGTIMNTWSESLGAKLHTDLRPTKWLKVSEHVSFEYLDGQGKVNRSHTGPILGAMWFPSSASVYDRDAEGNIIYDDKGKPKYGGIASSADMAAGVTGPNVVNPVAQLETMHSRAPEMRFFSTTSFEVKPVRGLTLKSDFTADLDVLETDAFQPVIDVPGGSTTTLREQEPHPHVPLSVGDDGHLCRGLRQAPHLGHGGLYDRLQKTAPVRLPDAELSQRHVGQIPEPLAERIVVPRPDGELLRVCHGVVPRPSGLFVRRPLFPDGQHSPRRLVEAALLEELRLVPGRFRCLETLLGEVLRQFVARRCLRSDQDPRRLGYGG